MNYYKEKGISKTVAKLAAERFANSDKVEMGVKMGTLLMINDLKCREDGFSVKALPKFDLPDVCRMQLAMAIEKAIAEFTKNKV